MNSRIVTMVVLALAAAAGCTDRHEKPVGASGANSAARGTVPESPAIVADAAGPAPDRRPRRGSLETVSGEVVALGEYTPAPSGRGGVFRGPQATLNTEHETVGLQLGPPWYLEEQGMKIGLHDRVEITGSRMRHGQRSIMLVHEIRKNDLVVRLRNRAGTPVWIRKLRSRGPGTGQ